MKASNVVLLLAGAADGGEAARAAEDRVQAEGTVLALGPLDPCPFDDHDVTMSTRMKGALDRIESDLARIERKIEKMTIRHDISPLFAKADSIIADYWAWAEEMDRLYS